MPSASRPDICTRRQVHRIAASFVCRQNRAMHPLVDIGINLTHESYDADRAAVIADAIAAGVSRMIVTGTTVTASAQAVELALSQPDTLRATAGVHPHHASEFDRHSLDALARLAADAAVVAIGECGLDYFRNYSPRDAQRAALEAQLELAVATQLPVFLHQRDAHEDMLAVLNRFRPQLSGGVAHCFTGDIDTMQAYLDLDLYIGITGWICDERRGDALRAAVTELPLERLMLETDAPYLLPRDLKPPPRDRRNEPRFLPHIARRVAELTGRTFDEIAEASTANAERLFALA
jgi:TatD DNase family protein